MYKILTPNQAIPKAYLHDKPDVQEVMAFKSAMKELLMRINPSEHEEFNKNLVAEFSIKAFIVTRAIWLIPIT